MIARLVLALCAVVFAVAVYVSYRVGAWLLVGAR